MRLGQIASIFRKADIEGYIGFGAPSDEYDSEAEALALALAEFDDEELTIENIILIIEEIWKSSFDLDKTDLEKRQSAIAFVAKELLRL